MTERIGEEGIARHMGRLRVQRDDARRERDKALIANRKFLDTNISLNAELIQLRDAVLRLDKTPWVYSSGEAKNAWRELRALVDGKSANEVPE